jgi:transglutaminase-like putative cysteine protease
VNPQRPLVVAAEALLLGVTLAAVLGMSRLFADGGWLGPLVANAVAAHVVAAAIRRRGLSLPVGAVLMAIGAAFVISWTGYWSTTTLGLPTGTTWSAMSADLGDAWSLYQDVVAPAPVEPGFVLASCLAMWVIAYVADWAAFRLWVPFEATLPASTLFLFTALLGTPRGRGWAVALYAGALIAFLLVHRLARQDGSAHWVADRRSIGNRSLLTAGAALGVAAVLAGTVLGPAVPGAGSPGVFDPRALRGGDARVTLSPLVDIRSRLVNQSDLQVFTVQSPERSYWRLTSLEEFDGKRWTSSGSFGRANGELPEAVDADVETSTFEQSFSIDALAAIWLPSAYEPRALVSPGVDVRYDEESATLIVDNDIDSSDGISYRVRSASPRILPEDLTGTAAEVPDDIQERFLELPDGFSPDVQALARNLTADATSPADQALALQDHLQTFSYSLEVQPGHSEDALEDFLFTTQVGYCEQFAGAFAAMARSIGLPARVAVGFTPGDEDPDVPGLYHVRGEYAHAWPEVYIAGAGWVLYEPTPGRGAPNAESYTGLPEEQAAAGNQLGTESPETTPTTEGFPSETATTFDGRTPDPRLDTTAGSSNSGGGGTDSLPTRYLVEPVTRLAPIVLGVALLYIILFPLGLLLWRALRRRRATSPHDRIELAWVETVEDAGRVGYAEQASDTYVERAHHLATALGDGEGPALRLARCREAAAYSPMGADDDDAEQAQAAADELGALANAQLSLVARVGRWIDPRSLVRGWRRGHTARQRRITLTARGDLEQERELVGSSDRG